MLTNQRFCDMILSLKYIFSQGEKENGDMDMKGKFVAFLGDSLTDGYDL